MVVNTNQSVSHEDVEYLPRLQATLDSSITWVQVLIWLFAKPPKTVLIAATQFDIKCLAPENYFVLFYNNSFKLEPKRAE